jgi:Fic family protein
MDRRLFSKSTTGQLVHIGPPPADWAFVPFDLPLHCHLDSSLWSLLGDAREALGELNGIGQLLPDPELLLRPLQSRESISSSTIEGTIVTPEQLLLYEIDPREAVSAAEKRAAWMEVLNCSRALREGAIALQANPFTHHVLRGIQATLMYGVRGRDKSPGEYRNAQVQIGSSARFVPPPPTEVVRLMDNLIEYANAAHDLPPLVKAFIAHYQFEAIHPFTDGNGRVGRALLSIMIQKWHAHSHPWLYLSPYFERFKDEYIRGLFQVSAEGDLSTWIEFCLRGTVVQAKDAVERCKRFRTLRTQYCDRVQSHSPRTYSIIEGLFRDPVVTISGLARKLQINYRTAQSDIEKLIESGILAKLKQTRPKAYYAHEVFRIAYTENVSEI